jgi:hypothetical protein
MNVPLDTSASSLCGLCMWHEWVALVQCPPWISGPIPTNIGVWNMKSDMSAGSLSMLGCLELYVLAESRVSTIHERPQQMGSTHPSRSRFDGSSNFHHLGTAMSRVTVSCPSAWSMRGFIFPLPSRGIKFKTLRGTVVQNFGPWKIGWLSSEYGWLFLLDQSIISARYVASTCSYPISKNVFTVDVHQKEADTSACCSRCPPGSPNPLNSYFSWQFSLPGTISQLSGTMLYLPCTCQMGRCICSWHSHILDLQVLWCATYLNSAKWFIIASSTILHSQLNGSTWHALVEWAHVSEFGGWMYLLSAQWQALDPWVFRCMTYLNFYNLDHS